MEALRKSQKPAMNIFGRITLVFIGLMLTVFLFCVDGTGYFHIVELKQKFFWLLCGGYPLAILIAFCVSVAQRKYSIQQVAQQLLPDSVSQIFVLLFALFCIVSTIFSQYPRYTLLGGFRCEGLVTILLYLLCYYLVAKFFSFENWLLWLLCCAVTVFSCLCIIQLQGYNPLGLYQEGLSFTETGASHLGTIGNIDLLSAFLCLVIPLFFSLLVKNKLKAGHFLVLPLILSFYVLIKMSVMAGFVGVFGSVLLSLPMFSDCRKTRHILWFSLLGLGLTSCLLLFLFDFEFVLFHEIHLLFRGKLTNAAGSGRIFIWKNVINRVPERLLFGHGADTMIFSGMPPFERFDADLGKLIIGKYDAAHNEYLNILYHHGIFALLSYLASLAALLYRWVRNFRKSTLTFVIGFAVIGYLLQAFFGISQLITAPYFWIAFGILEASMKSPSCSLFL